MANPADPDSDLDKSLYTGNGPANMGYDIAEPKKRGVTRRTCESLRLDLASAMDGKTWLLLPEGFRAQECGRTYPLPTQRKELQRLIVVPLPENNKMDCGILYVKRAIEAFKMKNRMRQSAVIDSARSADQIAKLKENVRQEAREMRAEVRATIESVKVEASRAIASLNDLFALGREGLGGIMKAHLSGSQWQGEQVTTDQFMGCFRMVSQAVKGLGLPSEQREKARDAVMEEYAKSLESTRSAISGSTDDEVQH